ncbi:MAG: response regulator [Candidatus Aminicenantia bacterium]
MKKEKILIVDDEEGVRELLSDFLKTEGYICRTARDGKEALNMFKNNGFDLIISDIRMPEMGGIELLKNIRTLDDLIAVIMITAVKDINVAIEALTIGAYGYVIKPFKLQEILINVERALEKRRVILENINYQKNLETMVEKRTEELKMAMEEISETYEKTLEAFVYALDTRDIETGFHSKRVEAFTIEIAKKWGISDREYLLDIGRGALIHDVGKIGVPDSILRKPSKLTEEEWAIMKKHPLFGYNIIKGIKKLRRPGKIVLFHHERFDGKGYPFQKKGREIPLEARIFAVADALDAMISDRPYRKAFPYEYAWEEIIRCSGTQFDPDIVELFKSISLERWEQISAEIEKNVSLLDDIVIPD